MINRHDSDLVEKLLALAPGDLDAAWSHVISEWPADRVGQDAATFLKLSMRLNEAANPTEIRELAFMLGEVTERLRWRTGLVPETNATPEGLALERLKPRVAFAKGKGGERQLVNAQRHERAEGWRQIARQVARDKPSLRGGALVNAVNRELVRQGIEAKSGRSIRRAIGGIS